MTYLTEFLGAHAAERPDDVALYCSKSQLTWAELFNQVEILGAWIASQTPEDGSVAIDIPTSIEFAVTFLATANAGRRAIIYDNTWSPTIRSDVEKSVQVDLCVSQTSFPDIRTLPCASLSIKTPDADTPLMVGFTSGSTGKVKGFERTHGSWVSSILAAQSEFSMRHDDRVCAPGSVSFSLFLYALAHCIYVGASLRLCQQFQPKNILADMRSDRSTVLLAVPTQAKLLIDMASRSGVPLSDSLRLIITSGAKWRGGITNDQQCAIQNAEILEFYGASELSFVSIARPGDNPPANSVGKAFDGVEIDIRGADGTSLEQGRTGAIWVRSPMLFSRYVIGESPECMWDKGFFTVGDHGYLDTDGFLYLAGREMRMIITSGANLYAEAVEAAIGVHESVENVSVIGIDEALRGQRVIAFLKLKQNGCKPNAREFAAICRSQLGRHAIPSKFYLVDDWPLAASGKTNHQALLAMANAPEALPQL
ncbi:AMP-binding protein [Thalassospiraceae bacterium LMO-JJ14]|nr:AMP-binding protein [Thalassospiraceae bacterium LMO-JJ14]